MSDKAWGEIMDEMDNEAKYAPSSNVAALKARIEALEAARWVIASEAWDKGYACGELDAAERIEALEAALKIYTRATGEQQPNDAVFPGFRGNNEA